VNGESPEGTIRIKGEMWLARASRPMRPGEQIRVVAREGLLLTVEPMSKAAATDTERKELLIVAAPLPSSSVFALLIFGSADPNLREYSASSSSRWAATPGTKGLGSCCSGRWSKQMVRVNLRRRRHVADQAVISRTTSRSGLRSSTVRGPRCQKVHDPCQNLEEATTTPQTTRCRYLCKQDLDDISRRAGQAQ